MIKKSIALSIIAISVLAIVTGIYGALGPQFSFPSAMLGLIGIFIGIVLLLLTLRSWNLSSPHILVFSIAVAAAILHGYEHFFKSDGGVSIGFFLWSLSPYALCLILSSFAGTKQSAIAGAIFALIFDLWGHYSVFINPQGSTAALALLFIPLWSTIIVVPLATFIAMAIAQKQFKTQGKTP